MNNFNRQCGRWLSRFASFAREDKGLVTVEWVALAAAMVIGAVAIAWIALTSVETQSNTVGSTIGGVANTTTTQTPP